MDIVFLYNLLIGLNLQIEINIQQLISTYGYIGFFIVSFIATLTVILPVPYLLVIYYAGLSHQFNPALIALFSGLGATQVSSGCIL